MISSLKLLAVEPTKLLSLLTYSINQVVHNNNVHGRRLDRTASAPLQRALARDHLHNLLRAECCSVSSLQLHLRPTLYPLPRDFPRRAPASAPEPLRCYVPCRSRYADQHDYSRLRPCVGIRDGDLRMGSVVDRQRVGADDVLSPDIRYVGTYIPLSSFLISHSPFPFPSLHRLHPSIESSSAVSHFPRPISPLPTILSLTLQSQHVPSPPLPRRNDSSLPNPHRRHRHRRQLWRSRRRRHPGSIPPPLDPAHLVRLLGHRHAPLVDNPDAVLPAHDDAQATYARGNCEPLTASRAAEFIRVFVSFCPGFPAWGVGAD